MAAVIELNETQWNRTEIMMEIKKGDMQWDGMEWNNGGQIRLCGANREGRGVWVANLFKIACK